MSLKKVKIIDLKKINNKNGDVIKILDKNSKNFKKFGEVYFSKIKKNYTKGWNMHKRFYCHITICYGDINMKLKDLSLKLTSFSLSADKPKLIIIPPKVWFLMKSKKKNSMILNILSGIHDQKETLKKKFTKKNKFK